MGTLDIFAVFLIFFLRVLTADGKILTLKQTEAGPKADVQGGTIIGSYFQDEESKVYEGFLGVPYAQPPVGKLRWLGPQPVQQRKQPMNTLVSASPCIQYIPFDIPGVKGRIVGEEDCLYMDIMYPSSTRKHPKTRPKNGWDVVVYIQGETFMWGGVTPVYPKLLLEKGVMFVTFNYRLNVFGFLSAQDANLPGNYGLKDQVMALEWIQSNIAAFGGNSESITLLGSSAGAASVHYHYLSPMSKGLFHQGISLSGTATCHWALNESPINRTLEIASVMNCPLEDIPKIVDCLRNVQARHLVGMLPFFYTWMHNPISVFGPVIEPANGVEEPFLVQHPVYILQTGRVQNLPWIVGVTSHEGLFPAAVFLKDASLIQDLNHKFNYLFPLLLGYNQSTPANQLDVTTRKIRNFYFGKKDISQHTTEHIIAMVGDRNFVLEAERSARLQAAVNTEPVYMYQYGYRANHSFSDIISGSTINWGVCHRDDSLSVVPSFYNPTTNSDDEAMSSLLVHIVVSFARLRAPDLTDIDVYWKPLSAQTTRYLRIIDADDLVMLDIDDLGHREFWDSLEINEETRGRMPSTKQKAKTNSTM